MGRSKRQARKSPPPSAELGAGSARPATPVTRRTGRERPAPPTASADKKADTQARIIKTRT